MLKSVPLDSQTSVGVRRLSMGCYNVLVEVKNGHRRPSYFQVGTMRDGNLTRGTSPEGQAVFNRLNFQTALQELREFAAADFVMSA
jgi:hypothetical protein